jgi:outer membrane protein OmpA-like peptidoglycan-associated protein
MQAQFGKRLGKAVENAAKNATVRKAEQKTEQAVGKVIDKATDPDTYKDKEASTSSTDRKDTAGEPFENGTPQQGVKSTTMAWNKFDFVSGDEIIFEDTQAGEQLGEFPSQWDMIKGNVEISQIDGENAIALFNNAGINPLMKNAKDYLPEIFTIEFDVYIFTDEQLKQQLNQKGAGIYGFRIKDGNKDVVEIEFWNVDKTAAVFGVNTKIYPAGGEPRRISEKPETKQGWHRISISFNKRALKIYFDETRIVNAPNVPQGKWFAIETESNGTAFFIKNVRIAKGAVPLYDRMMTDGKFITYGITFDIGKSTIKPESMGEINRIVKLMQDNPDLKFSVEGHTDSTGSAATNQKLSNERSAAVVAKLVETGISKDRLQSAGKGQSSPIADNGTDEGRAKNRRVEFVKIN